jgi:hypothetical protein
MEGIKERRTKDERSPRKAHKDYLSKPIIMNTTPVDSK